MKRITDTTAYKISNVLSRNRYSETMGLNPNSATAYIKINEDYVLFNFPIEQNYDLDVEKVTTRWFITRLYGGATMMYSENGYDYIIRGNAIFERTGDYQYNCVLFYDRVKSVLYISPRVMLGNTSVRKLICTIYEAVAYHNIMPVVLQCIFCYFPQSCNLKSDEIYDILNETDEDEPPF